jgi:ferredoxin
MKVAIDSERCAGHALCVDACPAVFTSDDLGYAALVRDGAVPAGAEDDVDLAIASCPERAIAVTEA